MQTPGDYREVFAGVQSLDELEQRLDSVAKELGFRRYVYWMTHPPDGWENGVFNTYPTDWKARYAEMGYKNLDPTLAEAARTTLPLRWDHLRNAREQSKPLRKFFEEASDFGISDGITLPIHGPSAGLATLNFSDPVSPDVCDVVWRERYSDLIVIGNFLHSRVLELAGAVAKLDIHLTQRERQVLLWTAEGKTAWEIGQILAISDQTVLFHLKNVMKKFGVYSKHHAVVLALRKGLI